MKLYSSREMSNVVRLQRIKRERDTIYSRSWKLVIVTRLMHSTNTHETLIKHQCWDHLMSVLCIAVMQTETALKVESCWRTICRFGKWLAVKHTVCHFYHYRSLNQNNTKGCSSGWCHPLVWDHGRGCFCNGCRGNRGILFQFRDVHSCYVIIFKLKRCK